LPEDEGAELLSIGNDWFAVLSDFGICRVISFCGLELYQFSTNRPIVSMCAYEHLLCLVYHDTLPILKNQQLKARIYDIY
jgi:chromosome transmission fidelity protein 4